MSLLCVMKWWRFTESNKNKSQATCEDTLLGSPSIYRGHFGASFPNETISKENSERSGDLSIHSSRRDPGFSCPPRRLRKPAPRKHWNEAKLTSPGGRRGESLAAPASSLSNLKFVHINAGGRNLQFVRNIFLLELANCDCGFLVVLVCCIQAGRCNLPQLALRSKTCTCDAGE